MIKSKFIKLFLLGSLSLNAIIFYVDLIGTHYNKHIKTYFNTNENKNIITYKTNETKYNLFSDINNFNDENNRNTDVDFLTQFEISENWQLYDSTSNDIHLNKTINTRTGNSGNIVLPVMIVVGVGTARLNVSTYHIEDPDYFYTLVAQELWVKPFYNGNNIWEKNIKYWMNNVTFNFDDNKIENGVLRDYQPKSIKPRANMSYNLDLSSEIGFDSKHIKIDWSIDVSSSYEIGYDSPMIFDKGNMADGKGKIIFSYINNNENKRYSISESVQTSCQIYRVQKSHHDSKPKINLYYDTDEICLWQNKKYSDEFSTWYSEYAINGDSLTYKIKVPKYIMEN